MKNYKILALLVVLLAFWSCSEDTVPTPVKGKISGTVFDDETGDPLDNVKITTSPASSTVFTNPNGDFILSDVLVDDYSVQAEIDEYVTGFESVTVTENTTSAVSFELVRSSVTNLPPTVPDLIFPENGADAVSLEVEFLWSSADPSGEEVNFTLDLRNGTTNEMQIFEVGVDTMYTVSNLQLSTNYFWQVTAKDDVNDPVSSPISNFTTFSAPDNPYLLVKEINGNNVIFSGNEDPIQNGDPDVNLLQLTEDVHNSFRPRRSPTVDKVGFLRSVGSDTQLFTMNLDGTDIQQVTSAIPVAGFRQDEIDFTWGNDGEIIYYPNFNRIYRIDPDGGGAMAIYQAPSGQLVSEIDVPAFDDDLLLIKTNDIRGYEVNVFTYRLSTSSVESVIWENELGAVDGISISADANLVLFSWDESETQNNLYRRLRSRLYTYQISGDILRAVDTDVILGENDLDASFSPSEGGAIFTRVSNNNGAIPSIYRVDFDQQNDDTLLFNEAHMADWK